MEPAWEGVGRDCIFIGECAWNATDRALITSQAILSIDRFAVWSFERGLSGGRHRPKEGVVGKGGERTGGWRVCNLCRWHVQKLADNGAVANPKN